MTTEEISKRIAAKTRIGIRHTIVRFPVLPLTS